LSASSSPSSGGAWRGTGTRQGAAAADW
jgi:hypothetical protein